MSEVDDLREDNAQLLRRALEAEQATGAFARGEVDAVTLEATATPVLLHAAQEKLLASEKLLRAVFDGALEPMVITDASGRYVGANPAACALHRLPLEKLIGRSIGEFTGAEPGDEAAYRAFRGRSRGRGHVELQRRDGTRAVLEYSSASNVAPGLDLSVMRDITDRRAAEEALRHSEARFRALIEKSAEAISLTAADGTTLYRSPSISRMLGWTPEELVGRAWTDDVLPEDRAGFAAAIDRLVRGEDEVALQFRALHRDGSVRWMEGSARNLLEDPDVGAIVAHFRDITARKRAEDALSENRGLLEEAQAIAHVGSWSSGVGSGDELVWSRECYRIFGVPEGTPVTVDSFFSHVHPDDREQVQRASRDAWEGVASYDIVHRVTQPDGGVRWVHERAIIARDETGQPSRMIGTVQDVTSHHLADQALRASEAKLRESGALLRIAGHAARLGGWGVSVPELRLTWSDEVCAIHEVPPGTVLGVEQAIAYYAPECRGTMRDKFEACARDGASFDLELQIVTATSRRVWVRVIGDAERDSSGAITMVRGAFQDIDDRRKLQDQLRQSQKMEAVGRLAGGVAHDFNNMLSVILSYAELSLEGLRASDPLFKDLTEIRAAGQRAAELTNQLLAFSRQQVLQPRVIDLNDIVAGMKSMLGRLLGEDIELTALPATHLARVLADPGQIEQVLMNLAVNARDAMPQGGKLTIETTNVEFDAAYVGSHLGRVPGSYVMLAMSDTGTGMDAATRARVFEPFFTTKEKGKGTGLGLATVFGIVEQSGGHVGVYSEPGHGSTFKMYFPSTDRVATGATPGDQSTALRGSETILLVEDEEQVRAVACTILRRNGYLVLDAPNGEEALLISKASEAAIDLLLTDVVMPKMSGRALAEHLAPERPEMKVLFASGYTDDAIVHHGVLNAGIAFLQKPFTPQGLLRRVREVLDAPRELAQGGAPAPP